MSKFRDRYDSIWLSSLDILRLDAYYVIDMNRHYGGVFGLSWHMPTALDLTIITYRKRRMDDASASVYDNNLNL
jgi:hypothetical protein